MKPALESSPPLTPARESVASGASAATPSVPLSKRVESRVGSASCYVVAAAIVVLALFDGRFRNHEGALTGALCFPIAVAAALASIAFLGAAERAAPWLALAIVGQAAALQLIDAGTRIHFERYRLTMPSTAVGILALATLAAHTAIVCVAVARRRRAIANAVATIGPVRAVLPLAAAGLCAAAVSPQIPAYLLELLLAALIQLVNLATIILFAAALPTDVIPRLRGRLPRWIGETFTGSDLEASDAPLLSFPRFLAAAAVWTVLVSALLSLFSYQRHPHVQDEVVYLHHARMLASGKLTIPAPPVAGAFDFYLMDTADGRWFATPPVGWPAVLALGVLAGAPWLVNPILGGAGIVLAGLLVRHLYDRRIATLVVLLLCASPWFLFINMSFMTHSLTLVCALLAALGLLRAGSRHALKWAVAGGAALGLLSLIRPLEGIILGTLLALRGLGFSAPRLPLWRLVAFGTAAVLVASIVFPYNHHLTGSHTRFPINVYLDREFGENVNALGFGPGRGMGWGLDPYPGHSPFEAAINTNLNFFSLNRELSGWATGSVLLLAFAALTLKGTADRMMLVVIVAVVGVHAFYWYCGGPDFGARYWYLTLIPCLALVVRAVDTLAERAKSAFEPGDARVRLWTAMGAMTVVALVNYVPWRALDKYHHYLGMRPDLPSLIAAHGMEGGLVLIRGIEHPDYTSAATYNPLDWHSKETLFAFHRSAESTAALLRAYPERPLWVVDGPTVTGRGYEVVAGPK